MFNNALMKYAKKAYTAILMALLLTMSQFAYGEAEKSVEPFHITYDGTDWKSYPDSDKIAFLKGFYQGAFYGALGPQETSNADERQALLNTISTYGYPNENDLTIVSAAVDNFYSDLDNLMIPVHEALVFIANGKKNENMIEEERVQWLKRAREYWKNK